MKKKKFSPLSFVTVFGSGIRDPGSEIRDPGWVKIRIREPGSGINIPDPPHWNYGTGSTGSGSTTSLESIVIIKVSLSADPDSVILLKARASEVRIQS
jgi:hypothetical protein